MASLTAGFLNCLPFSGPSFFETFGLSNRTLPKILAVIARDMLGLKNGAIKFVEKGVMGWGRVRAAARCAAEL